MLGALAESTTISTSLVVYATLLVGLLLILKTLWIEGRKCTWERDWAGKFLLVVVSPTNHPAIRAESNVLGTAKSTRIRTVRPPCQLAASAAGSVSSSARVAVTAGTFDNPSRDPAVRGKT